MITPSDFRDSSLSSILIGYDWIKGKHFTELKLGTGNSLATYLITELSGWSALEDFGAQHIEQCTFLQDASGIYLSLDPYLEGQRSQQDNLWFTGSSIERVTCSNSSVNPNRF